MNPSDARSNSFQNVSPAGNAVRKKQLISQSTPSKPTRKKYAITKEAEHSTDLSLQLCGNFAKARILERKDDKRYPDVPEQRNIGLPVIIDAHSENLSRPSVPEVFKQSRRTKTKSKVLGNNSLDIVVAEPPSYMDNAHKRTHDAKRVSPSKSNRRTRRDRELSHDIGYNTAPGSSERCESFAECEKRAGHTSPKILERSDPLEPTSMRDNVNDVDTCSIRFYSLRNKVVVVMSEKARFSFTGKLIVRAIYGAVEVYGYVITRKVGPIEVYSPRGYGSVSIEASENVSGDDEADMWSPLSAEGVHRGQQSKLAADIERIQPGMAVLLLSNLENKLTKFLGTFSPFRLFPQIWRVPYYSSIDSRRAEMILQSNLYIGDNASMDLRSDPRITQELAGKMLSRWRENEWSCTLVVGGQRVGKSSAIRSLTNSLLPACKMVVLLDVDLGQTECTPPGCISYSLIEHPLIGPNFTHLKPPVFQLYIGDVNVLRCLSRYIQGIRILVDKLKDCPVLSRLPIVVNTMGFTYGIGWHIALYTTKLIRPSHVVQIMSQNSKHNYIGYLSKQVVNRQGLPWALWNANEIDRSESCDHELIVVSSQSERKSGQTCDTWNMEPYQRRELTMISYLSEIVQSPINSAQRYDAASLSIDNTVPYAAPFSSLSISIPQATVPPTHALNVVNGNIVALGGIDPENVSSEGEIVSGLRVLDGSPLCTCYGFGIVRGVDMEREEVFISTPLPASTMRHVNCLMGCIPVPVSLLQSNQQKNVPYTGGNDVLPMNREHRRGYFRMRYHKVQRNA